VRQISSLQSVGGRRPRRRISRCAYTKTWFTATASAFGEAEIRIDTLIVHSRDKATALDTFYTPHTFRFDRVADGDRLSTGDGLLTFVGQPSTSSTSS